MLPLLTLTSTLAPTPTPTPAPTSTLTPTPTPTLAPTSTLAPTPTPTPIPSIPHIPIWSGENLVTLVLLLLAVLVVAVITIAIYKQSKNSQFFSIPYITWFLLHYTIAALGIVMIAFLGFVRIIDTAAIGTLLGSLFGYVLGAATSRSQGASGNPTITTPSPLKPAIVGTPYTQSLMASGGQPPYTWLASVGLEEYNLALRSDGVITGTPSKSGSANFTVFVIDNNQNTGHSQFTLPIN